MQETDRDGQLEKEKDEREVGAVHYALVAVWSAVSLAGSQDLASDGLSDLCWLKRRNEVGCPLLIWIPDALADGVLSPGAEAHRPVKGGSLTP